MTGIKNVVFLDAKGQPIEGRRTGAGYMNDAAELSFSVQTAASISHHLCKRLCPIAPPPDGLNAILSH